MRTIWIGFFLMFGSVGLGATIDCIYDSKTSTRQFSFNSLNKQMVANFKTKDNGKVIFEKLNTYLDKNLACMEAVNRDADCTFDELRNVPVKGAYDFQFSCIGGQHGELYFQDNVVEIHCNKSMNSEKAIASFTNCNFVN